MRCVRGAIWDVGVDLRPGSASYLRWHAVELTAGNRRGFYLPAGIAHGFQTLADDSEVQYLMGHVYVPDAARGVRWDDPAFAIELAARRTASARCRTRTARTRTSRRERTARAGDGCERLRRAQASWARSRARGFEVHAVSRSAPANAGGRAATTWHAADLLDSAARRALVDEVAASHLLHLAWYAEPGAFWGARENAAWVAATIGLVGEFAAAGGARATLAGSCAEYDWSAPQPLAEDAPLAPATYYGACKDATRRVAEGLADIGGLSFAWGRIFFLYGPGEDERRLVAGVARAVAAGERAATSTGTQRRDFLHVDDVAGAFAALLDSEARGPVNIASGEGVAVRAIAEQLGAGTRARRPARHRRPARPPRRPAGDHGRRRPAARRGRLSARAHARRRARRDGALVGGPRGHALVSRSCWSTSPSSPTGAGI